ncbi:LPXTG cell wall anchor domain-containing protein [Homoserinibacter sp. YIM 151385]|uniref:LPXTG cell wall anchor domain-containing protein n=1 Tax=Homoserinibacter sp. YIM 151385 TaxID=2985506 RepID=UPI0022F0C6CE|nr:LPXTG cell wall anchor domain-containing protein [Homoserinibacter sp. YIM 151385]WBU39145.1 LPXTG cell wall anchor domain-containing protein [Homoserinibacter sp. YIM 151385]
MGAGIVRRAIAGLAIAVTAAAGLALAPATSASASGGQLLVSDDGVNFFSGFGGGLFEDMEALAPLGSHTRSIWIRNATGDDAQLRISVADVSILSPELASNLSITADDVSRGWETTTMFDELRRCDIVVPSRLIRAGRTMRVDFSVAMLDVDGMTAQLKAGSLRLRAAMRDGAAGPFPADACEDDGVDVPFVPVDPAGAGGPSMLGHTGTEVSGWFVGAAALVGVGLLLVLGRRRRRAEDR